ncbi:hypothetical protein PL8927_830182 [Planktothrix serta PCC 8927]|uniref:Uncharacterized protein n=1 Tax=Planktothrix serta PCC 8927 TaxID=671068 RepID=A0A7Z9C3S7_9CYAN|nr:hypothetical protein PL8927_830182 [Planktothrix serta PCC 8927]
MPYSVIPYVLKYPYLSLPEEGGLCGTGILPVNWGVWDKNSLFDPEKPKKLG